MSVIEAVVDRDGRNIKSSLAQPSKHQRKLSPDDFDLLRVIGQGGYGKVFMVKKKFEPQQGQICAMKVLKKVCVKLRSFVRHRV